MTISLNGNVPFSGTFQYDQKTGEITLTSPWSEVITLNTRDFCEHSGGYGVGNGIHIYQKNGTYRIWLEGTPTGLRGWIYNVLEDRFPQKTFESADLHPILACFKKHLVVGTKRQLREFGFYASPNDEDASLGWWKVNL
jgi:hypothetical protein